MDRRTFAILCHLLRNMAGLSSTEIVDVEEMVAMFLHELIKRPVTVTNNCNDQHRKCLENCLGALDGTYIKVNVPAGDRPIFRTRKGEIATNVLGVCDTKRDFVYVLVDWEGSAADSRILHDALSRENGLQVPKGYYYLCDEGYPNAEGFLAPYRGQRYHLQEWRGAANAPTNPKEYFNMKHSSVRNVIERTFGVLKGHWAILRGKSEMTYCEDVDDVDEGDSMYATTTASEDIHYIETTNEWSQWRDELANRYSLIGNNGTFRPGYLTQLVRMMAEKLPGCQSHLAAKGLLNQPFSYYDELTYVFDRDRTMGRFAETFAEVGSNEPGGGYDRFDMGDGNEEFPPVYSQGIDLSQDDVRASRPSRASEGRTGSSGSKRKRGSQQDFDVEPILLALDQTNEQLR
ncbi:retrotransposon protein [Cucumis melo var. makuwa]|uniref:Retrotransposon protein n=1 Tax=Cucumis melo var. makuwa TaxID=1194695 RepID=A0A5A7U2A0_CUCMM|nr:retrotransposon protein [Cucumis melo var. makuwa]TYK08375.1 retrotransposon protein [Cucumis melo var. makuwa]